MKLNINLPTLPHGYAVSLLVQQRSHLGECASTLCDVLDCGGLHEKGIVGVLDAIYALLIGVGHVLRVIPHEFVHPLVGGIVGFLK